MTTEEAQKIVDAAIERGVQVKWAKRSADVHIEGIHIIEPNYEEVVSAILSAMLYGVNTVVIHSKTHWPIYDASKE